MLSRVLFHCESYSSSALNSGLLIFRMALGLVMAFGHGFGKLPVHENFVGAVAKMGLPLPELFAWSAALSEFMGGIFIALGLATRLSAASLAFTMGIAAFVFHAGDSFATKEKAIFYLISRNRKYRL